MTITWLWWLYWLSQDCVVEVLVDTGQWLEYWLTQDCVVGVLIDIGLCGWSIGWHRTVWWLYWFNPGLCGGCTGQTQDCVVVVLVEPRTVLWLEYWLNPGLCGGCTSAPRTVVVFGVLVEPMKVGLYWLNPGMWWLYWGTQDCVVVVLVNPGLCGCTGEPRTVWWLEYWLNPELCGGWSTGWTHDCVVGVLVDTGLCGGCTSWTQDCVEVVLIKHRTVRWLYWLNTGLCGGWSTG